MNLKPGQNMLALDLATVTGWAEGVFGEAPRSGSIRLASAGATRAEVLAGAIRFLGERWKAWKPHAVIFEAPLAPSVMAGKTNFSTARTLIALPGIVEALCVLKGIWTVREARVIDVRKFHLGGNPPGPIGKKLVMQRMRDLGHEPQDDNESDALALWYYAAAQSDDALHARLRAALPPDQGRAQRRAKTA